jgi:transcriptional regulator with XRE-family HTH domain
MKLRDLRLARGLTQQALGKKTGMDQGKVSRIERGKVKMTVVELMAIARALDTPPAELLPDGHERIDGRAA